MSIYDQAYAGQILTADWLNRHLHQTVIKAADQTITNSTTLQNITDLSFAAVANATYLVSAYIEYSATTATSGGRDIKFDVTVPTGAVIFRRNIALDDSVAASASGASTGRAVIMRRRGSGNTQEAGGTGATQFNFYVEFCYLTIAATAGTVQWQFAQDVAAASTEATVRANSLLEIRRVS